MSPAQHLSPFFSLWWPSPHIQAWQIRNWLISSASLKLASGFAFCIIDFLPWHLILTSACLHAWSLQLCLTLCDPFATLWTIAYQASLPTGFSRQEYWSGLPFLPPGDLPNWGIEPTRLLGLLHWQVGSLPLELPGIHLDTLCIHQVSTSLLPWTVSLPCLLPARCDR